MWLNDVKELEFLHVKGTRITIDGLLQLTNLPNLNTLLFSDDHPEAIREKIDRLQLLLPACTLVIDGVTVTNRRPG
jgi:hypothetical protein